MNRRDFLVTAGIGAAGLAAGRRAAAQDKKTLVVAWDSDIDSLDPAVFKSQGAYVTVANTTDAPLMWKVRSIDGKPGLFRSMPGEWDGHLAESWTMEDNGATIVLKVRRGMKFPSGRPITAPAFKYSFDRGLLSPGYMKLIFPTLIQVSAPEQFVVRDDYTFAIAMKAPSPMGLDTVALSNNAILDPEEVKAHVTGEDPWATEWLKRNQASVGPYRLVKNEPGVEIVLEATPGYWRPKPYFERVVLKLVPNEADRVLLLKRKAVDLVAGRPGLSPKNVKALEGEAGLKVFSVPDTTCHYLCMNEKKPPFDNKLVRQAVNYAIPIQAILPNVLFGYGTQMKSPVPNLTPTYLGDYSPYKHDMAKATDATFRQIATKGDHQLSIEAWQSWINDPFYHLTFLFNSKSKFTNLSAYSNPAVDKLIDENMHETNRDKRAAASRDIQKLVLDDAVWGLLWYENWTRVGTADLVGLEKRWDTFERYYSLKRT